MLFLIGLNSGRNFRSGKAWWWDQWARPQPCFVYGLQWGCGAFVVVFVVGLLKFLVRFVLCRLRWCRAIPAVHTPSASEIAGWYTDEVSGGPAQSPA